MNQIMKTLYEKKINSVMVEGGSGLFKLLLDKNLWDEARVFRGNLYLKNGTNAPIFETRNGKKHTILNDELLIFKNNDYHDNF